MITMFCFKCYIHKTCLTIDNIFFTIVINILNSLFENYTIENDIFKYLYKIFDNRKKSFVIIQFFIFEKNLFRIKKRV